MILTKDGRDEASQNGQPACSAYPVIRSRAPRSPASQKPSEGEVNDHRPPVTINDLPDMPDCQAGRGDIQLADVHEGLTSRADPVTQLKRSSPLEIVMGPRRNDDKQRTRGSDYNAALRQLANRLVGILHGCLKTSILYDEETAWSHHSKDLAA